MFDVECEYKITELKFQKDKNKAYLDTLRITTLIMYKLEKKLCLKLHKMLESIHANTSIQR